MLEDGVLRLPEPAHIEFSRNLPEHDFAEFQRQVGLQERALNQMSAGEWWGNVEDFKGRVDNQAAYRRRQVTLLAHRLREDFGLTAREARAQAKNTLANLEPLHGPDQRPGGNPQQITGMGDAGVNRSIGSQWASSGLADALKQKVLESLVNSGVPPQLWGDVRISVEFTARDAVGVG
ncbi:polymorphic toxin type 15 domain-containing protein [Cellulomonas denverensis]|uniref:polymorphic toxin type 15 domain-containing protein n=1 Tax=Cellulomonas denverensis TaxID=264297 RepID=UPI0035E892F2